MKKADSDKSIRDKWVKRLKQEDKAHDDFRTQAQAAQDMYFADKSGTGRATPVSYPLFWSTVKVLHGRIYSQPPKPDVRKRYSDQPGTQPVGAPAGPAQANPAAPPAGGLPQPPGQPPAAAGGQPGVPPQPGQPAPTVDDNKLAQCIERALGYVIDTTDFDSDGHMAVNDLLVVGLGIAKVEMVTETEEQVVLNPLTRQPIPVDAKTQEPYDPTIHTDEPVEATQTVITDQNLTLVAFSWKQFHWEPQQHWSQVGWVAFDHWMTADGIEDEFGYDMELTGGGNGGGGSFTTGSDRNKTDDKPDATKYKTLYCVHEIWDKKQKQRVYVCEDIEQVLRVEDDPLKLKDFFPCPKPMMLNVDGQDMVPMPDYSFCEKMFVECNVLTNRIGQLIKQVKDIGIYDAGFPELAQLVNQIDGNLIPLANLNARLTALGGKTASYDSIIMMQDNANKVATIAQLVQQRELAKQIIWEIYGVSDIQRGSSNPNETATAQNIKAEWADVRVGERIRIVALFFRDVFRIMAEIIAEQFQPDILEKMTGIQLNEPEQDVLRSDYGRCYAIDVESDSTVVQDEAAEKSQRLEFLTTVTGYLQQILPAVQHNVMPADLAKELLLFATNTFKDGRQLEQVIEASPGTMQQLQGLQQQVGQGQQQVQQLTKQLQDAQSQLQQVNAGKEQRETVKTAADAQKKDADTTETQVRTALLAQDIHQQALTPAPGLMKAAPIDAGLAANVATPQHFVG